MKLDNALVAALIAIGFFTCEANARDYVKTLNSKTKNELLQNTSKISLKNKRIEKSQPVGGFDGIK